MHCRSRILKSTTPTKTVDPTTENFCQICKANYKKEEEAKWIGCESDKKEWSYWITCSAKEHEALKILLPST